MRKDVLARFPDELLDQAISFDGLDAGEMCWKSEHVEIVLQEIAKNKCVISRGRVFAESEGTYFFTGLEWDVERKEHDWDTFVHISTKIALAFLKKNQLPKEDCFYALKFLDEEELTLRARLPKHFPERFISAGYSLTSVDCAEIAWKYEDVMQVIAFYTENHFIILGGGDVYKIENNNISITYDNWYYNPKKQQDVDDIRMSREKALAYIENYHQRNGDSYYYTLVVSSS